MVRIYLDYAAATPVAPEVLRTMQPYFLEKFGNPGSLHSFGQAAQAAVDRARETIARALGAQFRKIIFTGSATEANNLALRGATAAGMKRVIVSAVEHESVLETARSLKKAGVEVVELPVDKDGVVKLPALGKALIAGPALISILYANNETGTIQPIAKISKMVHAAGGILHTDAVQALQFLDCRGDTLGADLMTVSGHKIYGPKGVGALYVRGKGPGSRAKNHAHPTPYSLSPIIAGGGQEFGLRSGTENVPLIVGLAAAVEYIEKDKAKYARQIAAMKEQIVRGIKKIYPRAQLNGGKNSLPHIANVWIPGVLAQDLLIQLDLAGIAVSAGSACTARSSQPSHVLRAMGLSESRAKQSIRVSLGRPTTNAEATKLLKVLSSLRRQKAGNNFPSH